MGKLTVVSGITKQKEEDALERKRIIAARTARKEDLAAGEALGKKEFGSGSLGRVDANRSAAIQDILARRQQQLGGYTPEEQQAMREQNMKSIVQSQQAGSRDLARQQARAGVRGALASNQQGALGQQSQAQLADQERALFLSNIAEKRGALDKFEGSQRTSESDELGRTQFNLGQGEKEKAGRLASQFGIAGLGAAERGAVASRMIGDKQLETAKQIANASEGKK